MNIDKIFDELNFESLNAYVTKHWPPPWTYLFPNRLFNRYVHCQYYQEEKELLYNMPIDYFYRYIKYRFKEDSKTYLYSILLDNSYENFLDININLNKNFNQKLNWVFDKYSAELAKLFLHDTEMEIPPHIIFQIRKKFFKKGILI